MQVEFTVAEASGIFSAIETMESKIFEKIQDSINFVGPYHIGAMRKSNVPNMRF